MEELVLEPGVVVSQEQAAGAVQRPQVWPRAWKEQAVASVASEDAALEKALREVERERYLQEVHREVAVALVGFYVDPFNGQSRW